MLKFAAYLSKSFFLIWLTVVFGFLVLIGLLDSLANGGDIMTGDGGFSDTFRYMFYRAPVIFDRIFMFTIVVAILLTYVRLIRQHELVALLGFGISAVKQVGLLTPIVVGSAVMSIFAINTLMPPAVRALQAWGIGEYKTKNVTEQNPLWLEDTLQIVRASERPTMNSLAGLEFFERDTNGGVLSVTWAEKAHYDGKNWNLSGVQTLPIEGADGEPRLALKISAAKTWKTNQTPASIARLAAEPRDLSLSDMHKFRKKGNSGSKPSFAYDFWHTHRITRPFAAFILLICAVPLMQQTGREATGDKALITGITMGFIYLIFDGAMSTFAASGGIQVNWAISLPLLIFGLTGAYMCVRTESLT